MIDGLLAWLRETEGPLPYVVLAAAGGVEYALPFLPGDTVTLFGAFLAMTAGKAPWAVFLAVNAGSLLGALLAYGAGRWLAGRPGSPYFERPAVRAAIATIQAGFLRHGVAYLVVNRFLPALRAFVFVAAGMARMPLVPVLVWGGVSAALWNALILLVAWSVGRNWARLEAIFATYAQVVTVIIVAVALALLVRWRRRRRAASTGEAPPSAGAP